jgi:hypothetical protein
MNKLKIGLDVDDVLAAFYIAYALRHQKPLHPVDIWGEQWIVDKFKGDNLGVDFWINLPVYTPPEDIDFEVDCYISTLRPELHDVRKDWLMMNGFPDAPLFLTGDKLSVIKERDLDYFIDDKVETIDLINNDDCKCVGVQFIPWYHKPHKLNYNSIDNMQNFKTKYL